ncbi:hypothetical protein BST29_20765 [Mycobacterium malmoense]|uniref:DUF6883 domain-containing protein n=1 Tax=Mycobacterium malmoense TaxID=1780 RepID=A0ABX3SN75_MYCMA|nr:hypothetical protein BMG05_00715 [Mycobacterium malmoense]ORA78824.1 hypothetical protein BST29_20765 [Mycobacterium malmoense]
MVIRWSEARIDERKIIDYLLAMAHPVGGAKAVLFMSLGYRSHEWTRLRDDLAHIAQNGELVEVGATAYGSKMIVDGVVESPCGRMVALRTVWISDEPDGVPRLVTAYPS